MKPDNPLWILVEVFALMFSVCSVAAYYISRSDLSHFNICFAVWIGAAGWLLVAIHAFIMINYHMIHRNKKQDFKILRFKTKEER
jgi:hypothetical protein